MSDSKKRIAIITNFFPPVKYVGSNRLEAFAEYLSEDFEIVVFAEHPSIKEATFFNHVKVFYFNINFILEILKNNSADSKLIHLIKTGFNVLFSKIIKSPRKIWIKRVLESLKNHHAEKPFDFILSSSPYVDSHLVAIQFCSKNNEIKWICDLRDELSTNPYIQENQSQINFYRGIEKNINDFAFIVTSVSKPLLELFKKSTPKVDYYLEIKNGFNHNFVFPTPSLRDNKKPIQIGYFGSFYGIHKPDCFFQSLLELEIFDVEISFFGTHSNFNIPNQLLKCVKMYPRLEYNEVIPKMNEMDLNLLMIPKFNSKGIFTGKIFDYISARKPILAIIDPDGVASELIKNMNAGYVAEHNNVENIKSIITSAIQDLKNGNYKVANQDNVNLLHRKNDIVELSKLLKNC
jgi:hypothetical protein